MSTGIKNQAFGLELEFAGITRGAAARAIAEVVGGEAYYHGGPYDAYKTEGTDGRIWTVEYDGSIQAESKKRCEFVTPVCRYEDIPLVQECIRALRRAGARVNSSCGIHIHVDGSNHNAKSLKNLVFTMRAKEDLLYKAVGTQRSRLDEFCKPVGDELVENIKKIRKVTEDKLQDTWYDTYAPRSDRSRHYNHSRYHSLNLHSMWQRGTVEFRFFEATLHAGEVRAYINLCLAMSAQAINASRASAEPLNNGNDKYAMRCWLLRLGFIGDEYKTVRQHLLKNLEGNAAWRNAPETYESYNNRNNRTA